MENPEKYLQDQLKALENGEDLSSILHGLPDDDQELAPLLQLAAQIKQTPHPKPSSAQANHQQQMVMAAARETFATRRTGWKFPQPAWAFSGRLVGALVFVMAFILIAAAGSFAAFTMNNWTTVEVIETAGVVQVASQDQPESWRTIQSGERVREGERIRSSTGATATLRFSNGSTVTLGPQTDLTLTQVDRSWNGQTVIVLTQYDGETLHDVAALKTPDSIYQVNTPSGIANVTGTYFDVVVNEINGEAMFLVSEGSVKVESAGSDVVVKTGQTTVTQPNLEPEDPSYGFQVKGILSEWNEDTLVIGNIQLNISEGMLVQGKPAVGKMARAAGHIDATGVWWADLLTSSGGKFLASFSGFLEAKGDTSWQISGTIVLIDANTKLSGDMMFGDPVKVDFVVQDDGQLLATHIRPLDDDEMPPTPTTTDTPDVTPTATSTPTVTPTPTMTITPTATITGTVIVTDCTGADPQPTGMTLAERYNVSYDEIMGWFCQGYGFGEIDLAYGMSVEYNVPVTQIFAMREAGEGWGNIKKYFEDQVTPTPRPTKDRDEPIKSPKPSKTPKP